MVTIKPRTSPRTKLCINWEVNIAQALLTLSGKREQAPVEQFYQLVLHEVAKMLQMRRQWTLLSLSLSAGRWVIVLGL